MTIDLSSNARKLIAESPSGPELADFAAWLAPHQYTVFVIEQHLRHLAFLAPRLRGASAGTHSATQLRVVFGAQRNPHSRFHRFAGTRRVYQRFLLSADRLDAAPHGRFSDLLQQYDRYVVDVRGLSASSRVQHALTVGDLLERGLRPRQLLRSLTRADVERFVLLRNKEVSRHSLRTQWLTSVRFFVTPMIWATSPHDSMPSIRREPIETSCRHGLYRSRWSKHFLRPLIGGARRVGATTASCI